MWTGGWCRRGGRGTDAERTGRIPRGQSDYQTCRWADGAERGANEEIEQTEANGDERGADEAIGGTSGRVDWRTRWMRRKRAN